MSACTGMVSEDAILVPLSSKAQRQHLVLKWCGVGCSYRTAAGSKTVLNDIWGSAEAGQMQVGPHCIAAYHNSFNFVTTALKYETHASSSSLPQLDASHVHNT